MQKDSNKKTLSTILKLLYYIVIVFACIIAFFLLFYIVSSQIHANDENYKPSISIYTIVSPSMTPVINVYDVVINTKVNSPNDIKVGDIITYKSKAANSEGMTITHRVIEVSKLPDGTYEYLTQGDNNSEPDSLYVTFDTVIGKEIAIIPFIGRIQFLIANQKGWLFLLLIPIGIYLFKEMIKLIDLFNLRKKVDKVTGEREESILEQKRITKQLENDRKKKIAEDLKKKEIIKNSKIKTKNENENFLEEYTETVVSVKTNRYKPQSTKDVITEKAEEKKTEIPTKPSINKKTVKINEKQMDIPVIEENYEVLDTDELTSKIKEYDDKIIELDKMIKDIEEINSSKQETKTKETKELSIEKNDYLIGEKIKVVRTEPARKPKKSKQEKVENHPIKKPEIKDIIPIIEEEQDDLYINLSSSDSSPNPYAKVERPEAEDINEFRAKELKIETPIIEPPKIESPKKKESLNLNPNKLKKINRPNKKTKTPKNELNLNPSKPTPVRRKSKNELLQEPVIPQPIEPPAIEVKKPKKTSFLVIEKNKKKKK